MDEVTAQIKRALLLPLANMEISRGLKQSPSSVLLIGVPGTGKTLAVEELLQQDTGVLIIPLDPLELLKEMSKDKDNQTLLPRIAEVARRTDKRVVLHIDDIEKLAGNDNTYSTFLNLFAGVRESDFYVIASTNEPETIPKALIQPQRLSTLIYCGLQSERVRYEILKIHAIEASIGLKTPLFKSAGEREDILTTLAAHTEYFTPRYLEDIINVAKSHFLERVAIEENKTTGLTEDDLKGRTFCLKDFELAYAYVASICNCQGLKTRDEELRRLVKRSGNGHLGFAPNGSDTVDIFSALRHHN